MRANPRRACAGYSARKEWVVIIAVSRGTWIIERARLAPASQVRRRRQDAGDLAFGLVGQVFAPAAKERLDLAFGGALARIHHRVECAAEKSAQTLRPGGGGGEIVRLVGNASVGHGVISGSVPRGPKAFPACFLGLVALQYRCGRARRNPLLCMD